jgi:hypothetical protein
VGPPVMDLFSNLSKTGSTSKIKMGALSCCKNLQFFHVANMGYSKQFLNYGDFNISRAKNPGPDSTFESLKNLKRDLNLPEKSGKFSKILF